jgi:hypothetical protein
MHGTQNIKFEHMFFHVKPNSCNKVFNAASTVSDAAAVKTQIVAIHSVEVE